MNSKAHPWNIIWRIALLLADMLFFAYALHQHQWYVSTAVSGLLIPLLSIGLVYAVNRHRRELRDFLLSIQQQDYQAYYKAQSGEPTGRSDLDDAFHLIVRELQNVRIDKEAHYHHLRGVVEHLETGIISYKADGSIHLINQSVCRMLNIPQLARFDELENYHPHLYRHLTGLKSGERKAVHLSLADQTLNLALRSSSFKLQNHHFHLVSLQDIRSELEAREVESWQMLIRTLRHEIMNSATPISSLTQAARDSLEEMLRHRDQLPSRWDQEMDDLHLSLQTIHTRTQGLLRFVHHYRKITSLPEPQFEAVDLRELANHVLHLLSHQIRQQKIHLQRKMSPQTPTVYADFDQIQQVVINILLNAIDAVSNCQHPSLSLHLDLNQQKRPCLRVTDNGPGMDAETQQKIFVPFYTTRENGSGIGLSLARQIMKKHQGEIRVHSSPGKGTSIDLIFQPA